MKLIILKIENLFSKSHCDSIEFSYNRNMTRALIPSAGHIIFLHGSQILLLRRSMTQPNWPWHWCFPGGKVDEDELLREAAIRETLEEVGISVSPDEIIADYVVNARYTNGTRIYYFGVITEWMGQPSNIEEHLHEEAEWFSLNDLPDSIVPHHREAIEAMKHKTYYREYDVIA